MQLKIEVFGLPAPQGSKTVYRGRLVEASAKALKPWRKAISDAVHAALPEDHQLILSPVAVEIDLYVPRPATIKQSKRPYPIVPPDIDKLARAVLDGIGQGISGKSGDGLFWGDDSQVVDLQVKKRYADDREPGATITITVI